MKMKMKMKGFYVTGKKGSYAELEDGRVADTVIGTVSTAAGPDDTADPNEAMEEMLDEMDQSCREPLFSEFSSWEMQQYVGAK